MTKEAQRAFYETRVQGAFRDLFRVWLDTPNADEILADAARTIGNQVFGIEAADGALNRFEKMCREEIGFNLWDNPPSPRS